MSRLCRIPVCNLVRNPHTLGRIVAMTCLAGGLVACGYKGSLTLPEPAAPEPQPPTSTAPALPAAAS